MDAKKQQRGRESKWPAWYASLREYRASSNRRAAWQVANTLVPYFALWGVMIWTIRQGYSYWLTLALALVAALLRWFSSNIGYHHVHHLSPRIPNYLLKQCYDSIPALRDKRPLTISESLSCMRLKLWDEERKEMAGFP